MQDIWTGKASTEGLMNMDPIHGPNPLAISKEYESVCQQLDTFQEPPRLPLSRRKLPTLSLVPGERSISGLNFRHVFYLCRERCSSARLEDSLLTEAGQTSIVWTVSEYLHLGMGQEMWIYFQISMII